MKYVSTRGRAPVLSFDDVILTGLASDGGLYVPERWPALRSADLALWSQGGRWAELAIEVMRPYVEGAVDEGAFGQLVHDAVRAFDDPADPCPLVDLGDGLWLLELFHGPTLAFKDVALQVVGRLFDHLLAERGERRTILVATSGDTGSAAIEACRGREALDIVVLFPAGRVSEIQRRQMTTVLDANVRCVAVKGTFDDCQDLVKALFTDQDLNRRLSLSAMNSINWARVMPQVAYYVAAAASLGAPERQVSFAVPTGNFGNVFAGEVARRMGVPIGQLVVGTNRNDILHRLLRTGVMEIGEVHPTTSPSMDIAVSSNFERLLFELTGRDGAAVTDLLTRFRHDRRVDLGDDRLGPVREVFASARVDDDEVASIMADTLERTGVLVDPHTAVGLGAAAVCRRSSEEPMVVLATASPAKFPDAVEAATGVRPALPPRLEGLLDRPERYATLPADLDAVRAHVEAPARP
ncbi:MAG: threonine synthase [Actinomycetota bacterium]|nr:threonine synthase [Actinomycetota bacterium]